MLFSSPQSTTINDGDCVCFYASPTQKYAVYCSINSQDFSCSQGTFVVRALVGLEYGVKVYSRNRKGFVFLVQMTPELWSELLPHRTQIISSSDVAMIIGGLGLQIGAKVVESGTGSANMTHALAKTVSSGEGGKVYTFEYHQKRYEAAKEEIKKHHLENVVVLNCRDVYKEGFLLGGGDEGESINANYGILDLPEPWLCIGHLVQVFGRGLCRVCVYSPCIEQISRARDELLHYKFTDIRMVESLQQNYYVTEHYKQSCMVTNAGDQSTEAAGKKRKASQPEKSPESSFLLHKPTQQTRKGHTAYLLFASYYKE